MLDLFLLILLAHLLGDFIFQDDEMAQKKNGDKEPRDVKALLSHATIHFLLNVGAFAILLYGLQQFYKLWFLIVTVLTISHLFIDWIKPYWKCIGIKNNALIFAIDQGIHVTLICLISNRISNTSIISALKCLKYAGMFQMLIFVIIILILLTTFSNIFIRCFLEPIKGSVQKKSTPEGDNPEESVPEAYVSDKDIRRGRYIGDLERILTFMAICANAYTVLIGIFGTKTAMRFKEFDNRDFAEYYFIGTSLSALFAIAIGLFCRWLLT
jgi:hypothetical protein